MATNTSSAKLPMELLDSLLHSNIKRVILGALCGLASGCVMILVSTLFTPAGAGHYWWLQLAASFCYGGQASAYEVPSQVMTAGFLWHFGISAFLGLLFAKMTTSKCLPRLLAYGLVLGGLCWLASNMFAPDFFNITALGNVKEWARMFIFQSFTLSLAAFMSIVSNLLLK
jgi:hypothetical protein